MPNNWTAWCATCWILTRSQMGQLRLVKEPLDLGQMLKAVALVGEEMARARGLAWQWRFPSIAEGDGDPIVPAASGAESRDECRQVHCQR